MDTFLADCRHGLRSLAKNPGFTLVAVIALALGIGANTAIFSVVDAVLLLPYADPDRLTVILHSGRNPVAPANFLDWRSQNRSFERMGAAEYWTPNLAEVEPPEKLWALRLTDDVLPLLGVPPLLGRTFQAEEDEHQVVLSYRLWQRRFAGDPGILGRPLTLNGEVYTIVGVMPQQFRFAPFWATKAELWAPLPLGQRAASRGGNSLRVFARLKPDVTVEQAGAEMAAITGNLEKVYPGTNRNVTVQALKEKVVGNVRPALLVLLVAVGFVLLIACANVAHMMLARAAARQREIAVRMALGAKRSRVIRQFLTESLMLACLGGVAGLLLAQWGIRLLVTLGAGQIPRLESVALDGRVLGFLVAACLLTAATFGLIPALRASALDLSGSLKEGSRGSSEGIGRNRLRSLLIASEFALALMLLVGAGLMIRSFVALQAIEPGFDSSRLISMVVSVEGTQEAEPHRKVAFYRQLLQRVRGLPNVQSASAINHLPLAGDLWGWPFAIEGRPKPRPGEAPIAVYRIVQPGYFSAMRIPLLRGRDITDQDAPSAPGVVVVNEQLAKECWPGEDPIGKRISLDGRSWTVVGMVQNAKQHDWAITPGKEVYLSYLQNAASTYLTLVVRTSVNPVAMAPTLQETIWSLDRNVTISEVQTMDQVVSEATATPRFNLILLGAFASVALVLAVVGIYGVMSYSVSRRTQEIGIRMALGADRANVLRLVVGQGMILVLAGASVGLVGAFGLTRLMTKLLYGVEPTDPVTFVVVPLVLGVVAFAATYIPARRATRIDPLVALRYE